MIDTETGTEETKMTKKQRDRRRTDTDAEASRKKYRNGKRGMEKQL